MKKPKLASFKWAPFSKKQLQVLTWWMPNSPHYDKDAIICDGSVRAGKTVAMAFSFVTWAMVTFNGEQLGMAGKTIGALRRNVIQPLKRILKSRGFKVKDHRADNCLTITFRGRSNTFYLFGGKDESSQDLIQGVTLAGMFFDEVALMPESFVNQATARCSVDGAKLWFNCNPAGPYHWFKVGWLNKLAEKNALHLHFTMDDNLSLSPRVRERYKRMYSGVFYKRYILGLWVMAEGIIYDMFDETKHVIDCPKEHREYGVSIDYATASVATFGLYGVTKDVVHLIREYYWDAKAKGRQKTDKELADDFKSFLDGVVPMNIYIDPSAASLKLELRRAGYNQVRDADNDVINGIRTVAKFLSTMRFFIDRSCKDTIREFFSYIWDEKAQNRGEDKPVKENDHAMDRNRYFIYTRFGKPQARALGGKPRGW
ncbi:PBSX family phage terminase large subunit [Heliobacillus mobilis]|uniref:PBSX family phage terminase large subunit n=1 Tax=Heliobacterium mobile TaxID=28064 RepID=A0A6I3SGD3_HELMO|nr:PBSX family phage terminase large subunit [Heliobacterium mobile]MTV47751.1 PBSX family phage terminase large subunit [Heliobacterium mobile]